MGHLPNIAEKYIIYSESWGVWLGPKNYEGGPERGYWSGVNPIWRTLAPTYEDMEEAMQEISTWSFLRWLPSDISYIQVNALRINNTYQAGAAECRRKGAINWNGRTTIV